MDYKNFDNDLLLEDLIDRVMVFTGNAAPETTYEDLLESIKGYADEILKRMHNQREFKGFWIVDKKAKKVVTYEELCSLADGDFDPEGHAEIYLTEDGKIQYDLYPSNSPQQYEVTFGEELDSERFEIRWK